MQHIANALAGLKVGDAITYESMTLFPLVGGGRESAGYLTLDQALAEGSAQVTEVSEQGSVPELRFLNKGDKATARANPSIDND